MKNYIDGSWVPAQGERWESRSPADRTDILGVFAEDPSAVDVAVDAAKRAQHAWDDLGFEKRAQHLRALADAFDARKDEVARTISREVGKPLWEARGEAGALSGKVHVTLADSMDEVAGKNLSSGTWVDGGYRYRPLGVCAVIGPFNFPLHLANGHIIPALATGNTVVFKPSELAPECARLYAEIIDSTNLPPGVINVVQGRRDTGEALVKHPNTNAILFTGSVHVGLAIRRAVVDQPWKMVALELGGKNTAVILSDADLNRAAYEIGTGALLTAGQRCTGTSRVVVADSLFEGLLHQLERIWDEVRIGHPLDDRTFMGPLINEAAVKRFEQAAEMAREEGFDMVRENAAISVSGAKGPWDGNYVSPGLWLADTDHVGSPRDTQELFGPDVIIHCVEDHNDEDAARIANATPFGLAMSVFTPDRARFERIAPQLETGILNWNRGTVGATGRLPFGGVKMSGNHRPAALHATRYCTFPVATLSQPSAFDPSERMERFPNIFEE